MIGLDAREGVITAVTADGYQVSTSKGEVAIGRHDLLRVRWLHSSVGPWVLSA